MKLVKLAMAAVLVAAAFSALAQDPARNAGGAGRAGGGQRNMGAGMGMGAGVMRTIQRADVQADLKLTDDQKAQIKAVNQEMTEKMRGSFNPGGGPPDMQAIQKLAQDMDAQAEKRIKTILNAEQNKRFKEIQVQLQGARALNNTDVQKDLGLSEDQKAQIKKLQEDNRNKIMALREQMRNGGDRTTMRAQMDSMQKDLDAALLKVLTPDQAKKFKEMQGAPFKQAEGGAAGGRFGGGAGAGRSTGGDATRTGGGGTGGGAGGGF